MIRTLALDFETGGFDCKEDAICSLSISSFDKVYKKTWYVKPYNKNYSEKAIEVNGLTKEVLTEKGVPIETVRKEFIEFLNFFSKGYRIKLLGQNITFDIGFLKELIGQEAFNKYFHYHFKDTMIIGEFFKDAGLIESKTPLGLSNLYQLMFPEADLTILENAHSSGTDVEMCIDIYSEMLSRCKK
jgi:DNA polymerase III epsilon subunit-like protein